MYICGSTWKLTLLGLNKHKYVQLCWKQKQVERLVHGALACFRGNEKHPEKLFDPRNFGAIKSIQKVLIATKREKIMRNE